MDLPVLCAVLQAATSPLPDARKAAELQLQQLLFSLGFPWALLQVVARSDVDPGVRQLASIHFKNIVRKHWRPLVDKAATFSGEDKGAVRSHLLEALAVSPPQIRKQLCECMREVVKSDFPEQWPALLPAAVEAIQSADQQRVFAGLNAIRYIARKYEFKMDDQRAPVEAVVANTFPVLLSVLKHLLALPPSLEVANFIRLVLKTFWSSTYMELPPVLFEEALFMPWMECFLVLLTRPVPTEGLPLDADALEEYPWWKVKKWVLRVLNRLFYRYGDPGKAKKPLEKAFAPMFLAKCAPVLLEANVALLAQLPKGAIIPEIVTNLSLHYLYDCIGLKKTYALLKPHLPLLLSDVTFPLLCFNPADQKLWAEDPQEYVRKGYDLLADYSSARKAAMDFVTELLVEKSKEHLDTYLANILHILNRYALAPPDQRPYREKDGALLVVGALSDILSKKKKYRPQLESLLLQHVFPELHCPVGHLRAKAVWVAGQYAELKFSDRAVFCSAFQAVLGLLSDPELPVRVAAAVSLRLFIEASEDLELLRPVLPQLLNDIFRLMNEVENEDLVLTLEVLIENFGEEMAPYALGLVSNLSASFWKCMRLDESAEEQLAKLESKKEEEEEEENGLMAAAACLRALGTIMESVASMPQIAAQMEPFIIPILHRMLSSDGEDLIEEVLEIATLMTFTVPTISPQLWAIWPLMVNCLNEFAIEMFDDMLGPFDNFISRGTNHFLTCPDPNYPQALFQMVSGLLQSQAQEEMYILAAPKLLSSVLQNCKGRVDMWVEPYVTLVIQRLATVKKNYFKDLLILVVADAFHYNAQLTMSILQKHNAAAAFFQGWMSMIYAATKSGKLVHFKREYDKKVCILGLVAVLCLPPSATPPEVAQGQQQMLQALLKLLLALKEQEEEAKRIEEASDHEFGDDDDDDDDEDEWVEVQEGEEGDEEGDNATSSKRSFLAKRAKMLLGMRGDDGDDDDDDEDDDWFTDDEEAVTPIDPIDPFIFFTDAMAVLQAQEAPRFQALFGALDFQHQAMVHDLTKHTEVRRKEAAEAEEKAKSEQ